MKSDVTEVAQIMRKCLNSFIFPQVKENGGGILFYINEDIPFKIIESKQLPGNLETLTLEMILDKMKVLLMGLYKPPYFNEKDFCFI